MQRMAAWQKIPIVCKILLGINVALFVLEVILYPTLGIDLVNDYCLSPAKIIDEFETGNFTANGVASLFLSNLFHLNPWTSGAMGFMHIGMNMMTLVGVGKHLEKQFGSLSFLCFSLLFLCIVGPLQIPIAMILETMTMKSIPLLSTNQCGVGFSAVLFAHFMVYLRIIPNDKVTMFGIQMPKWMLPFVQLLLLSILLHASFVGHLSGIITGLVYVTGLPGCFMQRQVCIRNMENNCCIQGITKRSDFIPAPPSPKIRGFQPSFRCWSKSRAVITVSDTSDDEVQESFEEEEMDGLIAA